ncbi:hypothetical protein SLEP1_g8118 [Rubroshorea leprosula]|uniref:Transposase (putative) gypsy type domain-containing protein n=1 Tax=Rubroshorea leprosula TaxID=152421 RepID=A0AAV5I0M4_9ROSI|nr:hypothetical protein SLEP1_g8118 [Rubroshorea leprosula]
MSSEETLSDGRVRGRVEEVESRDLGVPSNIMEREDGREPCFNLEEEVVSEVAGYETTLENRGSLAHLVENYGVPGRVLVRPAGSRERACSAPGDHWMPLYSHYLAAGLRFPLPDLLVWLLLEYGLGLTQLTPNAVRLVVAFAVYSRSRGVSFPTANVFKYFYVLNAGSGREKGWYYFTSRVTNKQRRGLFSAGPSSIKGWKDKFFFADDREWDKTDAEVEHLSRWKAKGLNLNGYSLTPGEIEDVEELERGVEEMNKFLDAAGGAGIPKKGRGKRGEVRRQGEETSMPQAEVGNLAIFQPGHIGGEVTVVEEGPIVAKRKRLEQQDAAEEVPEPKPVTAPLRLEGTSSASAAEFAAALREQGYIRVPTTSFYDSGMRSSAKRFINAYFPEVDRQRAKDEVAARGSVGVVHQALEAINLVNALANEHHKSLKERSQMRKENAELVKKSEDAKAEVARLKAKMEELQRENATLKKDSEISYQKRKICEAELEKREKEVEEAGKVVAELELKVHNSVEEHVEGFLRSSTFEDIVNLYRLPTAIVAFSDYRKKVKLQYPAVDVTKITFGEQEGEVEEDGESKRSQMKKENVELVKKSEAAEAEVARLKAEMEELRKENATLKKDSEISYQKRKICEVELERREKEVEEAGKVVAELELKVHNSVEEHVEGFLRSSTFEDIVNLYRLPTAIVTFSNCWKKVKLQYPAVDVTKITFGEQEGEVEENGESSTTDFCPEVTLKWEKDSWGQTILPPKFSFEFVVVGEEDEGDEVIEGAERPAEGADQPSQPADNLEQPAASPSQTVD